MTIDVKNIAGMWFVTGNGKPYVSEEAANMAARWLRIGIVKTTDRKEGEGMLKRMRKAGL